MAAKRSRRRPYGEPHPELDLNRATGGRFTVSAPDGDWTTQRVRGSDKSYTCPGCNQTISPGLAHLVAWRTEARFGLEVGVDSRRHWHPHCFETRRGR